MGDVVRDPRHTVIVTTSKSVQVAQSGMKAERVAFTKDGFERALKKVASAKPSKRAPRSP